MRTSTYKTPVDRVLDRHQKLKMEKQPWLNMYQLVGEYVMTRKQNFTNVSTNGEFLTENLFDSTAATDNQLLKAYLIGALWPNAGRTFRVDPPDSIASEYFDTKEVKEWFDKATKRCGAAIDNPKSGFGTALDEYMLDQGGFGISGISALENYDEAEPNTPVKYQAVDCKKITVAEGYDGFINTVYIECEYTVRQLIEEYGEDDVSQSIRDFAAHDDFEKKVKILHAIEPRPQYMQNVEGNQGLPISSMIIDITEKHLIRESGYTEMPVFVTRFWKAMGEVYGRSPAMECMPDILEVNAIREASIEAIEKYLNPPLMLNHDGSLGGGVLNTSAGALNIRMVDGRMSESSQRAVEQIITTGELTSTYKRIEELQRVIDRNFMIDRLSDLNNETRMTLGEANIRNDLREMSLGSIYSRQITEMFGPLIERTFRIMFRKGLFGYIQDSDEYYDYLEQYGEEPELVPEIISQLVQSGHDVFKISFVSPAARIMRTEELQGIQQTMQFVLTYAPTVPSIIDYINEDKIIQHMQDLTGAPADIIRATDEVKKIRDARQQQAAQQAQMQQAQIQSEIAKNTGQAAASAQKAGLQLVG